jgi:hypothetical protein
MSKKSSKEKQPTFTRVAVEGATVDGRTIQRVWLTQAAKNYDPEVKGARIWVEHMRSVWSDSPFSAQGDVVALKAEEIKTGKLAGKMALYAAIKPLPDLVEMNKKGKKVYSSIEVEPKFADTGEAYLTGLAVTDDPASLGVEMLKFSAKRDESKFSSEPLETTLEFGAEDETKTTKTTAPAPKAPACCPSCWASSAASMAASPMPKSSTPKPPKCLASWAKPSRSCRKPWRHRQSSWPSTASSSTTSSRISRPSVSRWMKPTPTPGNAALPLAPTLTPPTADPQPVTLHQTNSRRETATCATIPAPASTPM